MHKFTKYSDLTQLPLPPDLITQVQSHLLEPFDSEQQAEDLWQELSCQLWLLCSDDEEDEHTRNFLTHAVTYPEWEELIGDDYKLTLTIICDDGQGLYLLFYKDLSLGKLKGNFRVSKMKWILKTQPLRIIPLSLAALNQREFLIVAAA